ncbi:MAG: 16S rRNA (guanine(966)-N(2))-methyltransferase RsmD [Spongiibacteraceae bacterium]
MTKSSKKFAPNGAGEPGQLRIIGGQWRGRKLLFPSEPGLRPSPDRVRETLFNWLMHAVAGARCLDLFAGSGALGLEALSRGASHCTFVDSSGPASRSIGDHLRTLQSTAGSVANSETRVWLRQNPAQPFDLVFLDPPFRGELLGECCELLESGGWLAASTWIYIETAADETLPALPANWRLHRDRVAGKVAYRLFERLAPV